LKCKWDKGAQHEEAAAGGEGAGEEKDEGGRMIKRTVIARGKILYGERMV
jgi:hypothetical protein